MAERYLVEIGTPPVDGGPVLVVVVDDSPAPSTFRRRSASAQPGNEPRVVAVLIEDHRLHRPTPDR